MDFSKLSELFQGNTLILILLGLFLFKDQLLALIGIKPKPEPAPAPTPVPVPVPVPVPAPVPIDQRPIIDIITKLMPMILPLILDIFKKGAEEKAKELEAQETGAIK